MPQKHQIPTLQDLALRSVGEFVATLGKNMVRPISALTTKDPKLGLSTLHSLILSIRHRLSSSVPWHLYDTMATETLRAVRKLINETEDSYNDYNRTTDFVMRINIVASLTQVIIHPNLKRIEFSAWPKIMRHVLYDTLHSMTGLEVLDLGAGSAGWRTSDIEKLIIAAVAGMKNLASFVLCFDCTDNIIAAVGHNCSRLQKLDVTASRSVTDRSIPALLKCRYLREVKLLRTSVTVPGYADLLIGQSCLEDIGGYDELGSVLEFIRAKIHNFDKPFRLRAFDSRNMTIKHLYLLTEMFPYITSLSIMRDERVDDLTILASLNDLRELKLLSCDFYAHGLNTLLEMIGGNIVTLHLEHVGEVDLSALIYISQYCPNIKNLVFYNCEFLALTTARFRKLAVPPFKHLERFKCVVDCADSHLEFILSHCVNVKFIQLGSSTGIRDSTMRRVFAKNSMSCLEELKILYSDDLSMSTVRLLMQSCENLRRLSELESWEGISPSELDAFREEVRVKNVDLDTSPTLSLA